jgi:hypothetical protein
VGRHHGWIERLTVHVMIDFMLLRSFLAKFLLAPILLPVPALATTVVVIRTRQRVVIAADSLASNGATPFTMCKIGVNPRFPVSFAIVGYSQLQFGNKSRFSAIDLAEDAISSTANLHDAGRRFESTAAVSLLNALRLMKKNQTKDFERLLQSPEPVQVVFAAVENGVPAFVVSSFSVQDGNGGLTVSQHESACPGSACPYGQNQAVILGENGAARRQTADVSFWKGLDPLSAARKLVEVAIESHPKTVGPPISIITIDASGTVWNDKGVCQ